MLRVSAGHSLELFKLRSMTWNSGLQLRCIIGPDEGAVVHLNAEKVTIGRRRSSEQASDSRFLLVDKAVSRQHAELVWNEVQEIFQLRHLSKTNFTWLDEEPVESVVDIRPGQVIRLGGTELQLEAATELPSDTAVPETQVPGQITKKLSFEPPAQKISIKGAANPYLVVQAGPGQGKAVELEGLYLSIGRENLPAQILTNDPKAAKFDQMVELEDSTVLPNHVLLKWDALKEAFSTWKNPQAPSVPLRRRPMVVCGFPRSGDRLPIYEPETN